MKNNEGVGGVRMSKIEMIFNGGNPLEGCPRTWEEAYEFERNANESDEGPQWKFDCGFKLDFDGPLVSVSSRFYPPKTHYGPKWDGVCEILVLGETVKSKKFECETLEELKEQVRTWVRSFRVSIEDLK